ncbi:HAD-IA family hydrolase [Candidatus Woesebacteria bacterium]|nr:HAD-IA family hydrolase [Candidatus Woesebacteria bacterium]
MIQAICFDVDGTLIDTTDYIYQAFEHSLADHDHDVLSRDEMQHMIGQTLQDCYRAFAEIDDVDHLMDSHHAFQNENPQLAVSYPNTKRTLIELKKRGIAVAAVTSRARETAVETLELLDLFQYIDTLVGLEDVSLAKPDPEGIFLALNTLGMHPADAVMVGDSDVDIEAGKNAKMMTIGVTYGFHGESIVDAEPDHVIDDIAEVLEIVEG